MTCHRDVRVVSCQPVSGAGLRVIRETRGREDLTRLDEYWRDDSTFALIPSKGVLGEQDVLRMLEVLPKELRTDSFVLQSSGSTGLPKLMIGSRSRAEKLARVIDRAQRGEQVSRIIAVLPLSYSFAFVNQWVLSRVTGRELILISGLSDVSALRTALEQEESSMICLVGSQTRILMDLMGDERFSSVSRVHFAGGRFPAERLPGLRAMFPEARFFNNYGCVEAMPRISVTEVTASTPDAADVGLPLEGIDIAIGKSGEVTFQSPYSVLAWIESGELHVPSSAEWLGTGDLGRQEPNGRLTILGRKGEVFKRFGEKVSLPLMTDMIRSRWPGELALYREADVTGEDGFVVALSPRATGTEVRCILQLFRENCPRATWPLRIESVRQLPRLPNDKIDLEKLRRSDHREVLWRQRF